MIVFQNVFLIHHSDCNDVRGIDKHNYVSTKPAMIIIQIMHDFYITFPGVFYRQTITETIPPIPLQLRF